MANGGLPMRLRGEDTGFELTILNIVGDPEFADIKIDPHLTHCAMCRFGAGDEGSAAAVCFAVAVAKLANGALYDPQSERLVTLKKTIAWAHKILEEARRRPISQGTRPRDIRRYLNRCYGIGTTSLWSAIFSLSVQFGTSCAGRLFIVRPSGTASGCRAPSFRFTIGTAVPAAR